MQDNVFHVIPFNDLEDHEEGTTCKCQPSIYYEDGCMIVVHNAFDGREGVEMANAILNAPDD